MSRKINVAEDIIPIAKFKTHASQMIRRMHETRRPLVITQNGEATAVVLTPDEFEDLGYKEFVRAKIQAGIDSEKTGPCMTTEEMRAHLRSRRQQRKDDAG